MRPLNNQGPQNGGVRTLKYQGPQKTRVWTLNVDFNFSKCNPLVTRSAPAYCMVPRVLKVPEEGRFHIKIHVSEVASQI